MFGSNNPLTSNQLPISLDFSQDPEDFKEFVQLYLRRIANAVNTKEAGLYTLQESAAFQQYFTPGNPQVFRNVYRETFDMVTLNGGPIATGATASFAHGISGITSCTRIFGTATNSSGTFLPLPFVAFAATNLVQIFANATNVSLVNGSTQSALTQAYITLEYVKT